MLRLRLAWSLAYGGGPWLSTVLFWNYIPFLCYLLWGATVMLTQDPDLRLLAALIIFLINLLYQLYLWFYSFFWAQDVSEGRLDLPELNLSELLTGWPAKLRLALIRGYYYLPLIGMGLVTGWVFSNLFTALTSPWLILAGTLGAVTLTAYLFTEVVLMLALYRFSRQNRLLAALNAKAVVISVKHCWLQVIQLIILMLVFYFLIAGLLAIATVLFSLPIVGALLFAVLAGFITSWHTMFLPALHGQIWQRLDKATGLEH